MIPVSRSQPTPSLQGVTDGRRHRSRERSRVFVDLSDCTFIDSTVIALLLAAHRNQVMRNERLELILPKEAPAVERILTLSRIGLIITTHKTRNAALTATQSGE